MKTSKRKNLLVIGDTHLPFTHKHYLDFCIDIKKQCKCEEVVHIGDLVDCHAISYHEHDPDGLSPKDEFELARKMLKSWYKAFPKVKLCLGNHDKLIDRKGKTAGLPSEVFLPFRDIWQLPDEWEDDFEFTIDDVRYIHGTGYSGRYAHVQACLDSRKSTVIGHLPSSAGIEWMANEEDRVFGANVGCGIDRHAYAMAYGKDFRRKPILSVGVVTDAGKHCQVMPMDL